MTDLIQRRFRIITNYKTCHALSVQEQELPEANHRARRSAQGKT